MKRKRLASPGPAIFGAWVFLLVVGAVLVPALAVAASVLGTVTDGLTSAPIANAKVILTSLPNLAPDGTTVYTDAAGQFEAHLVPATYEVKVFADDYLLATFSVPLQEAQVIEVDYQLTPGSFIEGLVQESNGDPSAGGVRLFESGGGAWLGDISVGSANGDYRIGPLMAGSYIVASLPPLERVAWPDVPCPGSCSAPPAGAQVIVLGTGETRSDVDFLLPVLPEALITGVVASGSGVPLGGADVSVRRTSNGAVSDWVTNGAGLTALSGIIPDDYQVRADALGFFPTLYDFSSCGAQPCDIASGTPVTVAASEVVRVTVELAQSGSIRFRKRTPTLFTYYAEVFDHLGDLYRTRTIGFAAEPVIDDLEAGDYFLVVHNGGQATLWPDIDCSGGCDPTMGAPITVSLGSTTEVERRFLLDGFETRDLRSWSHLVPTPVPTPTP